jgi:hypothetical protein
MNINQQKLKIAELLLPLCPYVVVQKHPTVEGIPAEWFHESNHVTIRIGQDQQVMGIPDLSLDETGWRGTLTRLGRRHNVFVPWETVQQIFVGTATEVGLYISGTAAVWPTSPDDPKPPKRPGLKVVR